MDKPRSCPSSSPTSHPRLHPSCSPTSQPSSQPSSKPFSFPTSMPSRQPSSQPSAKPSSQPTTNPSAQPSSHPTVYSSLLSLTSAVFSSTGLEAYVRFSTSTDMLGLSAGMNFACNKVLIFGLVDDYTCMWKNSSEAVIRDTTKGSLVLGSKVQLFAASGANSLRISCTASSVTRCPTTIIDTVNYVLLTAPSSVVTPSIGSFVTSRISNCSAWQMDLSTPSVTSGNAGRPWSNATFRVQGLTYASNTTAIVEALYAQFASSSLLVIRNSLLERGETYAVEVVLCNFLNSCGSKKLTTAVSNTSSSLPPIATIIDGGTARIIYVNESLQLTADAYLLQCDGKRSTSGLHFIWQIKLSSSSSWLSLVSQSKDSKKFLLSAYTLQAGMSYWVRLTAQDTASLLSSSVNISVSVLSADLVAVISPSSSQQQVRVGSGSLLLNASSSYDPDTVGTVSKTRLSYLWTCRSISMSGTALPYCAVTMKAALSGSSSLTTSSVKITAANESWIGSVSTVTVTVYDPLKANRKNSTATVQVEVIASTAPLLSVLLSSSSALSYINIGQSITVDSTVLSPIYRCNASWLVDDPNLDVDSMVSPAYTKAIPANHLTYVNLHLSSYSLVGGSAYVFTLSCRLLSEGSTRRRLVATDTGSNSSVSIHITTNSPPLDGRLHTSPLSGYALNTSFLISTDMWVDVDLPLSYTFSFLSSVSGGSGTYLPLTTKSEVNTITAILASASGLSSSTNVSVIAEDSHNASSGRVQSKVQFLPVSASALNSLASSLLSQKGSLSVDELQNVVSVVTSVVNIVDCSASPNCSSLHRGSCQSTANTCGPCYSGYLSTGSDGSDNSVCLSQTAIANPSSGHSTCMSSSSCASWQYCNASSFCADSSKSCSSPTCSSHGSCRYISSSTSQAVSSCSLISSSCVAVCKCVDGYAGADCSLTASELAAQQALRSQLLDGLSTIISKTDSDASSVTNAAASLSAIVRDQYDVSANSSSQVSNIAQNIVNQASQVSGGSGNSIALNISSVLNPIDSAISAVVSSGSNSSVSALKNLSSVIFGFQDLLIKDKQSYSAAYDTFRLTTVVYDNAASTSITVPMALTQQEQIEKSLGGSSNVPSVTVTSNSNTTGGVYVSVVLIDQQTYTNKNSSQKLNSDVITIRTKNIDYIDITLTPTSTQTYTAIHYTITCPPKIVVTKNFTCPDSGTVMYARCNGTAGTYNGTCPVLMRTCASLSMLSGSSSSMTGKEQCFAVNGTRSSSSAASLTCRCVISSTATDSTVAAGLVLQYVGSDISRTFRASAAIFSNPAALSKAYVVVALYSALWGSALLAILFFGWKRWRDPKKKKTKSAREHRGDGHAGEGNEVGMVVSLGVDDAPSSLEELKREGHGSGAGGGREERIVGNRARMEGSVGNAGRGNGTAVAERAVLLVGDKTSNDMVISSSAVGEGRRAANNEAMVLGGGTVEVRGAEPVRPSLASSRRPSFHAACPLRHLPEDAVAAHDETYLLAKQFVTAMYPLLERRESHRLEVIRRLSSAMGQRGDPLSMVVVGGNVGVTSDATSFQKLRKELIFQRSLLRSPQLEEFDRAWCLDGSTHEFTEIRSYHWLWGPRVVYMENFVKTELLAVSEETEDVLSIMDNASDVHKGFEILQLFVRDLLGRNTPAARIFAVKAELDFEPVEVSSWQKKVLVGGLIAAMNIFFVYYTILKGYTKGVPWQQDYVKAWVAQVLLDIFLFETILCTWLHILVPYLVSREVSTVYILLQECIRRLNDSQYYEDPNVCLNAADYFFVSRQVAQSYPQLVESALVLSYANHLPGEVGKAWQKKASKGGEGNSGGSSNNGGGSGSWWRFLKTLMKGGLISCMVYLGAYAPLPLQRLVIRVMEPVILSGLTLGFYFFVRKPVYLAALLGGLAVLSCLLLWDYYRMKRTVSNSSDGRGGGPAGGVQQGVRLLGRSGSARSFQSVAPVLIESMMDVGSGGSVGGVRRGGEEVIGFSSDELLGVPPPAPAVEYEEESPMLLHKAASGGSGLVRREWVKARAESEDSVQLGFSAANSLSIPSLAKTIVAVGGRETFVASRNARDGMLQEQAESEVDEMSSSSDDYDFNSDEFSIFSGSSRHNSVAFVPPVNTEVPMVSGTISSSSGVFSDVSSLPSPLLSPFLSSKRSRCNSYATSSSGDEA
eukprot:gene11284-12586_t